jgi:hypothetical protein
MKRTNSMRIVAGRKLILKAREQKKKDSDPVQNVAPITLQAFADKSSYLKNNRIANLFTRVRMC